MKRTVEELLKEIKISIENSQKPSYSTKNWLLNADLCCDLALKELKNDK